MKKLLRRTEKFSSGSHGTYLMQAIRRGISAMEPFYKKLFAIASLGLILRLVWVSTIATMGFDTSTDQVGYVEQGYRLAELNAMDSLYQPPLYPHFLGVIIKFKDVVGLDDLPLRGFVGVIQAFIAVGVILLLGMFGRRRVSERAGLFAAFVFAIWPNQIMSTGILLTERLATPLLVLGVVLLLWDRDKPRTALLLGAGFVLGLATLSRTALILVLPAAFLLVLLKRAPWKGRVQNGGWLVAGVIIALAPWFSFTYWVTGEPLVLSTAGGFNLCLGNNNYANGGWSNEAIDKACPWPNGAGHEQVERDSELRSAALTWMRENPDRQWPLIKKRFQMIYEFDRDALAWYPTYRRWDGPVAETTVQRVVDPWWNYIVPLSGLGIFAFKRRLRWELLAITVAISIIPLLSVAEMRYKDPIVPFMALSVGVLIARIWDYLVETNQNYSSGKTEIFVLPERSQESS